MLDLLHKRYSQSSGNGQRYAKAEHVRSHAGFGPMDGPYVYRGLRTADFVAMDLWPSKGLELHGHEVKVSRSDWLSELKDPEKAEQFKRYMDRWWLVAPKEIVRDDLPAEWGLLSPGSNGELRVVKPAPKLNRELMPVSLMACLLRAVAVTASRPLARKIERRELWDARHEWHANVYASDAHRGLNAYAGQVAL